MSNGRFERYVVTAQRFGARTLLFQTAAARKLDLTATELECFRMIQLEEPLTASDLVKDTGLTPASLSVIVDKLVARGFLTREQDSADRRRWLLRTNPAVFPKVDAVFSAHGRRAGKLLDAYSGEEFDVVMRFMDALAEELHQTAVSLTKTRPSRTRRSGVPRSTD